MVSCNRFNAGRIILKVLCIACFIGGVSSKSVVLIISGIFYVAHLILVLGWSITFQQIKNKGEVLEFQSLIKNMRNQRPYIIWNMSTFHKVREVTTTTTKTIEGSTEVGSKTDVEKGYWKKVTTWKGSLEFSYNKFDDNSDSKILLENTKYTRWKFFKCYSFADDCCRASYNRQKSDFIQDNMYRDQDYEFDEEFSFKGYIEGALTSADGTFPWHMNTGFYAILTFLLIEVCYEFYFDTITHGSTYTFEKVFICGSAHESNNSPVINYNPPITNNTNNTQIPNMGGGINTGAPSRVVIPMVNQVQGVYHNTVYYPQGMVTTQQYMMPSQQGMIPVQQRMVSTHQGMVPTQQYMMPTQQGMIPVQQGMVPAHQGMVPTHQGMVPTHQGMVPTHQGMTIISPGVIQTNQGLVPAHQDIVITITSPDVIRTDEGLVPDEVEMIVADEKDV